MFGKKKIYHFEYSQDYRGLDKRALFIVARNQSQAIRKFNRKTKYQTVKKIINIEVFK